MKLATIALAGGAVALVLAVAALAGVGRSDSAGSDPAGTGRTITVSGTGSVTIVPDQAHFSFGVDTRGETATEALAANGAALRRVIAALRAAGIDPADIRTQQVSVSAIYSEDADGRVTGYQATNAVGVTVRRIAEAGALVDRAVAAGANEVSGPALDREDLTRLYHEALEAALADAQGKAEAIAAGSGLTLGRASQVSETTSEPAIRREDLKAAPAAAASTPIEAGTEELQATVSVTFEAN